jgi:hypothetical protein
LRSNQYLSKYSSEQDEDIDQPQTHGQSLPDAASTREKNHNDTAKWESLAGDLSLARNPAHHDEKPVILWQCDKIRGFLKKKQTYPAFT